MKSDTTTPISNEAAEDTILIEIAQGGVRGDRALRRLYDTYGQHLLRFFVYQGASATEAEDVLQDTLIKVYKNAAQYVGEGSEKSWIWQVARNTLLDAFRKSQRIKTEEVLVNSEQWSHFEETVASPRACVPNQGVDDCVAHGLEDFAQEMPERALALNLYLEGTSMDEIAMQIGRSAAATKEYLSQCRKKIKPYIAHCTEQLTDE